MKRSIVLVLLLAMSACCHKQTTPVTAPETSCQFEMVTPEDGDYEVYNALMSDPALRQYTIVISETTFSMDVDDDYKKRILEELPSLEESTLDDYVEKNYGDYRLGRYFSPDLNYILLSEAETEEIFETPVLCQLIYVIVSDRKPLMLSPGWRKFYKKYPDSEYSYGINAFSRVGFNPNRNQALLHLYGVTGPRMVGGYFILLVKENGEWVEKESFRTMI